MMAILAAALLAKLQTDFDEFSGVLA